MNYLLGSSPLTQSKTYSYLQKCHGIALPVSTSCLAGWPCSIQGSLLGKTTDDFSHPKSAQSLMALWKLIIREAAFSLVPGCFSMSCTWDVWHLQQQNFHLFLMSYHKQWKAPILFGVPRGLPHQQFRGIAGAVIFI